MNRLPFFSLFVASRLAAGWVARAATGTYTMTLPAPQRPLTEPRGLGTPRIGQPPTTPRALLQKSPRRGPGHGRIGARRLRRLRKQGVLT